MPPDNLNSMIKKNLTAAAAPGASLANTDDYAAIISAFLAQLDTQNERTRRAYSHQIRYYFDWIQETGRNLSALDRVDVLAYRDHLAANKGLAAYTIAAYLTAVRLFYQWANSSKIYPNITDGVKLPRRQARYKRDYLPADLARQLVKQAATTNPRDYAIIMLLTFGGLRTIEVIRANVGDLGTMAGRRYLSVLGKGHTEKDQKIRLTAATAAALDAYLSTRPAETLTPDAPLFLSCAHNMAADRLTTKTIRATARKNLDAIGLTNQAFNRAFNAHSLRHTCGCLMLEAGATPFEVQQQLRHANPATTQIYTKHVAEHRFFESSVFDKLDNSIFAI